MSSSTPSTHKCDSASSCTDVKIDHFTYQWVLKNFTLLPQDTGEYVVSPIIRMPTCGVEWILCLYPQGKDRDSSDYVSMFLSLHYQRPEKIKMKVHAEFSILETRTSCKFVHVYPHGTEEGHGFPYMMQRSELLESIASQDQVTIFCKIDIAMGTITKSIDTMTCRELAFDSQGGQWNQDFRRLLRESKLSDVVLIAGTQRFSAHKVVLAARSSVFSAMFENTETQENLENEVEIEDMEPAVVEAMLEFFYTDEVTNLEELAYGLLGAADKYDLQHLKGMCEKILFKTLNKDNAAETLIHADLHCCDKLKEYVMEFMTVHLSDVVQSENYREIEEKYPALSNELIRFIAVKA